MSLLATNTQNTQNLFYRSENTKQFSEVLDEVQSYISSKYSALVVDGINNVGTGNDEIKRQVKRYIGKYLLDYRLSVEGLLRKSLSTSSTPKWQSSHSSRNTSSVRE